MIPASLKAVITLFLFFSVTSSKMLDVETYSVTISLNAPCMSLLLDFLLPAILENLEYPSRFLKESGIEFNDVEDT